MHEALAREDLGDRLQLQVTPAVNFSALDEVMVVTGVREGPRAASEGDEASTEGGAP